MPLEDGQWDEDVPVAPVDPASTTFPGLEVESDDSLLSEPHSVQEETSGSSAEDLTEPEPMPEEFDPKFREDFEGLLYLGRLTDTFTWLGHSFVIRTLTSGEILEVGLLHRKYVGSLADVKAYQAAVVAACVVSVDGKPMPTPITNEALDTGLINRFRYVLNSWYAPTLDAVYERYLLLEARVQKVIDAMGKAPGSLDMTRT